MLSLLALLSVGVHSVLHLLLHALLGGFRLCGLLRFRHTAGRSGCSRSGETAACGSQCGDHRERGCGSDPCGSPARQAVSSIRALDIGSHGSNPIEFATRGNMLVAAVPVK